MENIVKIDKLIVKFTKLGDMRYISHLDLMRLYERAFRRAGIPIAYTKGFNPHPRLSFAAPLALGVSSIGEYLEIELENTVDVDRFIQDTNQSLPEGIKILKAQYVDAKQPALMSLVRWAEYKVILKGSKECLNSEIDQAIAQVLSSENLMISKQGKDNKIKEIDIRPGIDCIELVKTDGEKEIYMNIATGSKLNIRPEFVVEAILTKLNHDINNYRLQIERIELYTEQDHKKIPII